MPGKSQQGGRGKQESSKERLNSASQSETVRKPTIWPEWTEAELAAEKWDLGGGKSRAKSSANNVLFEDTEGILLPPSLLAAGNVVWKRVSNPVVLSTLGDENPPVIVLDPECDHLDLISSNTHLMHSEFMCWMLSQLSTLWQNRRILAVETPGGEGGSADSESAVAWRPWEHIQPHPKGTPAPQFNPSGKYCVRLYWMGCWRKVTVDDFLPFLEEAASATNGDVDTATATQCSGGGGDVAPTQVNYVPLYPRTGQPAELWPALLTKAVLKIAALDYSGGSEMSELGDCSVIHMFTGWTPLIKSLKKNTADEVWNCLSDIMPMWKRDSPLATTEEQRKQKKCIVLAGFTSTLNKSSTKPISPSQTQIISTSEATLKQAELLPSDYTLSSHPSYPIPLCQVRDEPLVLPPAEPPLPTLQAPYYLGLKNRVRAPGEPTPPPTPPPVEPRWVELVSPFSLFEEEPAEIAGSLSGEVENDLPAGEEKPGSDRGSVDMQESKKGTELKRVWMDYLDFIKAFQMLYIFNSSNNFKCRESFVDLSQTIEGSAQTATSAQPSKKSASASQLASASKAPTTSKPLNLLFVDSPNPVTLHIVLASFSNWREGQRNTHTTTQRRSPSLHVAAAPHPPSSPPSATESSGGPQNENDSGEQQALEEKEYVIAGSLIVEEYSWKSIQSGKFVLRLTTTGTKGTSITLPPGRHVFKLHVRAPIGHHLEIFSHTPFVLTDQDGIFTQLRKETSLYLSHGSNLVRTLLSIASELSNGEDTLEDCLQPLVDFYSQYTITNDCATLLLASAVQAWAKQSAQYGLSSKMQFAWKAFLYKALDFLKQHTCTDSSTLSTSPSVLELRRQLQTSGGVSEDKTTTVPDSWTNREATVEEEHAANVVQRSLRHHLSRCREQNMVAGTETYQQTLQELQQSIPLIEPSVEELGAIILRGWFKLDPSLLDVFPFCQDEKSRAFSTVYTGAVPLLSPNTWTIVLREVFHIQESQIVVPQFECPVPTHLLRVIDNDTNTEVPRIFHNTPPCVYHPNSRGYTFQAEAWNNSSEGMLTEGGKWSLRIVSSSPDLPKMEGEVTANEEVTTTFYSREIVDYCLPDRDGCIFRYFLKAAQDCSVSIQLCTSKQNAICKLEIMDNEITKVETRGRGNCILPLYLLEANQESEEGDVPTIAHKYVVRATILRDSWPLSESAWPYISMIKSVEKLEERPNSKPGSARKGKKEKGAGGKKGTTPQQSHSNFSQVTEKPHWTLRIVTKSSDKENLEVKKDTERADALKGMVQAWEVEQPGRSKKAQESRQKYLDAHAIKESVPTSTEEDQSIALSVLSDGSTAVPHPNTGPVKITQMDLSPFIIKHEGPAKLFDESEERARLQERQKLFKDYRTKRQEVMQVRNADREQRNQTKVKQLEQAEQWQADLDVLRNKLNAGREAIREKHLAKERARQEAEQAALKAQEEQQATAGRDSKMAKGAKGKGKKK